MACTGGGGGLVDHARQPELVRGRLPDQLGHRFLLAWGKGRLLPWTPAPAPFRKGIPAALAVAVDPAAHRFGVDADRPCGFDVGHAVQDRPDGSVAQRCLGCA